MLELERSAAAHWRGTEETWLGEWLLRAAEGFTGRANSALALGDPGLPLDDALAYVVGWYRDRGLPAMIAVPMPLTVPPPGAAPGPDGAPAPGPDGAPAPGPDGAPAPGLDAELTARGWATRPGPAYVMVADLPLAAAGAASPDGPALPALPARPVLPALPAGAEVTATAEPDAAWLARYHYRGADSQPPVMRDVLTSAEQQAFVSIRDSSGVLAIARLSVADGWAGLTAVEVDPARRRSGLGAAITAAACAQALGRGARRIFLQVEVGNAAARALYQRCGFRDSHWYHYRMPPA